MKKQLLLLVMMVLPLVASADAVEINGIYYNLITKAQQAEVTSNPNQYTGSIVIPESVNYNEVTYSVTSIGNKAFRDCSALTSIKMPNSVTSIGGYAFLGCSGLTSITIGNGIQNINSFAFGECPYLTDVTCHAETVPNTANDAFKQSQIGQATLYVALASVNAYKAADPWKSFKSIVAIEDITDVNSNLNCTVDWNGSTASSITPWGINYARGVDLTINNYSDKDIKIAKIDAYINSSNIGSLPDVENTDIPTGTQKVFSFSISNSSAMPSTLPWLEIHYKIGAKTFVKDSRVPGTTSIHEINNEAEIIGIYDINGRKFNEPQKGLNIIRMNDGATKKVIVK